MLRAHARTAHTTEQHVPNLCCEHTHAMPPAELSGAFPDVARVLIPQSESPGPLGLRPLGPWSESTRDLDP
jgi:hypothetical protein